MHLLNFTTQKDYYSKLNKCYVIHNRLPEELYLTTCAEFIFVYRILPRQEDFAQLAWNFRATNKNFNMQLAGNGCTEVVNNHCYEI